MRREKSQMKGMDDLAYPVFPLGGRVKGYIACRTPIHARVRTLFAPLLDLGPTVGYFCPFSNLATFEYPASHS